MQCKNKSEKSSKIQPVKNIRLKCYISLFLHLSETENTGYTKIKLIIGVFASMSKFYREEYLI